MASLPTLQKTWIVEANVYATTNYQTFLLTIVNKLLSYGWTCDGSSNSSTGAMDGVNRWASTANIVRGDSSGTNPHSWIVLRNPKGRQLLLDYWGFDAVDLRVYMSGTAGLAGGTNSVAPTCADRFGGYRAMGAAGSGFSWTKCHFIRSSDGANIIIWGARTNAPPFNARHHLIMLGDVVDFESANYASPCTFLWGDVGGSSGYSFDGICLGGQPTYFVALVTATPHVEVVVYGETEQFWNGGVDVPVWRAAMGLDVINGLDNEWPIYDPLTLVDESIPAGRFGVWPDVFPTVPVNATQVDSFPADGSQKLLRLCDLAIPWGVATVPDLF